MGFCPDCGNYHISGGSLCLNDSTGCRFRIQGLNSKHVHKNQKGIRKSGFLDIKIEG